MSIQLLDPFCQTPDTDLHDPNADGVNFDFMFTYKYLYFVFSTWFYNMEKWG